MPKEKEEKVVKRDEKLSELRMRKKHAAYGGYNNRYNLRAKKALGYPGGIASNISNHDDNGMPDKDTYDKINGEKVLREYGANGLRNAVHFIIS